MSNRQAEMVEIKVLRFVHHTNDAELVLVVEQYGNEVERWIPASQIHSITRHIDGSGSMRITPWIAKQKGLR